MEKTSARISLIFVILFIILSVIFLILPCRIVQFAGGFFGSVCTTNILFVLINFPSALLLYLVVHTDAIYKNIGLSIIAILLNSLIYFLLVYFIAKLFSRKQK